MAWATMDKKVAVNGVSAGSDIIPLTKRFVRRLAFHGRYTVTDAGISAGENVDGWMLRLTVIGDGEELFRVETNEMRRLVELLAPYGLEGYGDISELEKVTATACYSDADPTTAEVQRFWFVFNFSHDFRMYNSVNLKIEWRAATDEWGGASAMTATLCCSLEFGTPSRSIVVAREYRATSTTHDIDLNAYPTIGLLVVPGSANILTVLRLKGKDGTYDLNVNNVDEANIAQAAYNLFTSQAPADDDLDYALFTGFYSVPYTGRQLHVEFSSTGVITVFLIGLAAVHKMAGSASFASQMRGDAPTRAAKLKNVASASEPKRWHIDNY